MPGFAPSVAFHPPPLLSGCCFLAAAGGLMEVCALSSHRTASSVLGDHRCWGSHDGKPRGCSARTGQQESCQRLWWAGDGALSSEGAQRAQLIQALKQQAAAARRGDSFLKNPLDLASCSESPEVLGAGLVCCSQLRFSVNPSVAEAASARRQLGSRSVEPLQRFCVTVLAGAPRLASGMKGCLVKGDGGCFCSTHLKPGL